MKYITNLNSLKYLCPCYNFAFPITQGREKTLSTEEFFSFSLLSQILKIDPAGKVRMKWVKNKFYPTDFNHFQSPSKVRPE